MKPALFRLLAPLLVLLAACSPAPPPVALLPTATLLPPPTPTLTLTPTQTSTPTVLPTPTLVPPTPTATYAPVAADERTRIFEEVWATVRDSYVYTDYRGVNWAAVKAEYEPKVAAAATPEAFYDLLDEMIAKLGDDHSRFESPRGVAEEDERFSGDTTYAGIGAMVHTSEEGGLLTRLAHGGPAEQAGLHAGDIIIKVGGKVFTDTDAFDADGPIGAVRGVPGSTVRLTVRVAGGLVRELEVERRTIPSNAFPQIEAQRLPNSNVGLLTINTFYLTDLVKQVRGQVEQLAQTAPLDGLIIDVRNNSGGRIDMMLGTVALFADGGSIGSSSGRADSYRLLVPKGALVAQLKDTPIVVLTGEATVSAAEMFAGGMQALGRAKVVGMRSAGNVENLSPHDFADGSRLWLAERTYKLPDGTLLEGRGVQPNRTVAADWRRFEASDDPQVQAALAELRSGEQGTGAREQRTATPKSS